MNKKFGYALIAVLFGLMAYHYYAAARAEQNIMETVLKLNGVPGNPYTLSVASVEIAPFSGDIRLGRVSLIEPATIYRTGSIFIDLSYGDLLTLYFSGPEEMFASLRQEQIALTDVSHLNRNTNTKLTADRLNLMYSGNLSGILTPGNGQSPGNSDHRVSGEGSNFVLDTSGPDSSSVTAGQFHFAGSFRTGKEMKLDSLVVTEIVWNPPADIEQSYGFFIRGFGYASNALPVKQIKTTATLRLQERYGRIDTLLMETELFSAALNARIGIQPGSPMTSTVQRGELQLFELSDRFSGFLDQLEKLTGIRISEHRDHDRLRFNLGGTIQRPSVQPPEQ